MLRTDQPQAVDSPVEGRPDPLTAFPGLDEPYASLDRSVGILFYQAKQGFFLPYHSLQSMDFASNRISLEFPGETVVIVGRGLHGLSVGIARQSVCRIVEQGERGSAAATCIARIRRIPKEAGTQSDPNSAPE